MTHNRDHIVIHSLAQPVSIGSENPNTSVRVWWLLPLIAAAFVAGLLVARAAA